MQYKETDNNNKEQKNKVIEFNKNIADFKNLESSENLKKYIKSENNDEESENINYSTQVQSWLFTHNNYFFKFHSLKKYLNVAYSTWNQWLILSHNVTELFRKIMKHIML